MAGGLLFSWTDEWFKFTWNTLPRHAVVDSERRALWHDALTNEQWFGIVAQDPVDTGWRTIYEARQGVRAVAVNTSEGYVKLTIHLDLTPSAPLRIELDSAPGQASGAGYAVAVEPGARSATAYVRAEIDPIQLDGLANGDLPERDPSGWEIQRMTVNRAFVIDGTKAPAEFIEIGRLIEGSWDPKSLHYDSQATWSIDGSDINIRLPWLMLGIADPSSHTGVVPGANNAPMAVQVPEIPLTIDIGAGPVAVGAIRWDAWQEAHSTERMKAGAKDLAQALADTAN
jgi:hypothetical protein